MVRSGVGGMGARGCVLAGDFELAWAGLGRHLRLCNARTSHRVPSDTAGAAGGRRNAPAR